MYILIIHEILHITLFKNGSQAEELKSCTIKKIGKVMLNNVRVCAFETL